jgi:8-oxo-dGTP pyrophosphatase MutT (NUDIX family)
VHRRLILDLLERYVEAYPVDLVHADHVRQFVRAHADCFERSCREGHVTGSAWILSPDLRRVLLAHHRKLDRWLQLGGHADGQSDPLEVALREAREESGLLRFTPLPGARNARGEPPLPLDVDVHLIPARGDEPAHLHHDVRYLLIAEPGQELVLSDESNELRWVERASLASFVDEESLLRMERKTRALLGE